MKERATGRRGAVPERSVTVCFRTHGLRNSGFARKQMCRLYVYSYERLKFVIGLLAGERMGKHQQPERPPEASCHRHGSAMQRPQVSGLAAQPQWGRIRT